MSGPGFLLTGYMLWIKSLSSLTRLFLAKVPEFRGELYKIDFEGDLGKWLRFPAGGVANVCLLIWFCDFCGELFVAGLGCFLGDRVNLMARKFWNSLG